MPASFNEEPTRHDPKNPADDMTQFFSTPGKMANADGVRASHIALSGWEIGREIDVTDCPKVPGCSVNADMSTNAPSTSRRHAQIDRIKENDAFQLRTLIKRTNWRNPSEKASKPASSNTRASNLASPSARDWPNGHPRRYPRKTHRRRRSRPLCRQARRTQPRLLRRHPLTPNIFLGAPRNPLYAEHEHDC